MKIDHIHTGVNIPHEWISLSVLPFVLWPGRHEALCYCSKAAVIKRLSMEACSGSMPTILAGDNGLLPPSHEHLLAALLPSLGKRLEFVGDLDPLDICLASQLSGIASQVGRSVGLSWYHLLCKELASAEAVLRKFCIAMDEDEMRVWQECRACLGGATASTLGQAVVTLFDSGSKLELEGLVLHFGEKAAEYMLLTDPEH
jgi:hypothetical protein